MTNNEIRLAISVIFVVWFSVFPRVPVCIVVSMFVFLCLCLYSCVYVCVPVFTLCVV